MATQEYDKNNTTRINLKLNNKTDSDIIEKLNSVENVQGFIKAIIRNEMEGETTMKHFERKTEKLYGARDAGYRIDKTFDCEENEQLVRKIRAERGDRFVNNKLDSLYDFDGDLYTDENGNPYAVVFVYDHEQEAPLFWCRLVEAKYHVKGEYMDLWGSETNDNTVIDGKDLERFAADWETTVGELIDQLDLIY